MRFFGMLALMLSLALSDVAYALRCGHALVQVGDHKHEVSKKCGEPDSIEQHFEIRAVQSSVNAANRHSKNPLRYGQKYYTQIEISVEEWIYDFGRSRFGQLLRFENGVLTDIKDLERGE
ncbi:MAG: DUF2845 domain-containing protein [Methylococcaceae bacterium]